MNVSPLHLVIFCVFFMTQQCFSTQTDEGSPLFSDKDLFKAIHYDDEQLFFMLVSLGLDIDTIQEDTGDTPLIKASKHGYENLVHQIVVGGADMNVQNKKGQTAAWIGASRGHHHIVETLAYQGASLNVPDESGSMPVHILFYNDSIPVDNLVYAYRALSYYAPDVLNKQDKYGWTAYHYVFNYNHSKLISALSKGKGRKPDWDIQTTQSHLGFPAGTSVRDIFNEKTMNSEESLRMAVKAKLVDEDVLSGFIDEHML